ncbi:MAG: hypothetical protein AAB840_01005 [Patescibacteria group bacterium]
MAMNAIWYTYQIWKRQINPTLSTWIIFLFGTGLSLTTYTIAENHDFRSGILNTVDAVSVLVILIAIIVWGKKEVRFKPFEKWYLGGVGMIVLYGLTTGDAWSSNVFTQVLIALGYFPTIQNLVVSKRNTESFTTWSFSLIAGIFALYPAVVDGNVLAVVYSLRSIVCIMTLLSLMAYYELRQ